jgi:hypothetical protein
MSAGLLNQEDIQGLNVRYCESDVLNTYRVWLVCDCLEAPSRPRSLIGAKGKSETLSRPRESANPHLCLAVGIQGTEMKLGIGEAKC